MPTAGSHGANVDCHEEELLRDGMVSDDEDEDMRDLAKLAPKLSLIRRQVGEELKANAIKRAKSKRCCERLWAWLTRFWGRYEYAVILVLAIGCVAVYSFCMNEVFVQLINITDGKFDSLQLQDNTPLGWAGVMLFFLTVIVIFMTLHLMSGITGESVGLLQSAQIYFITILYFSCIYLFIFCTIEDSFGMDTVLMKSELTDFIDCGNRTHEVQCSGFNRMVRMNILWLYFATTTQTSVGFGDISPSGPVSEVASDVQMMAGMVYSVFILGQTVRRITTGDGDGKFKRGRRSKWKRFFRRISHNPCVRKTRRLIRRYIFLVSLGLQVALFTTLYVLGADSFFVNEKDVPIELAFLIICFNVIQLMVIVLTTTKFVRKTDQLYMNFLLQSFGSVCLTMASVYVAIHSLAYSDEPFKIDIKKGDGERKDFMVIVLQFFHFSLCLMTTVGYGDIYPVRWYSRLVVAGHMLLSVLYMEVMFGLGLQLVKIDGLAIPDDDNDDTGLLDDEGTTDFGAMLALADSKRVPSTSSISTTVSTASSTRVPIDDGLSEQSPLKIDVDPPPDDAASDSGSTAPLSRPRPSNGARGGFDFGMYRRRRWQPGAPKSAPTNGDEGEAL